MIRSTQKGAINSLSNVIKNRKNEVLYVTNKTDTHDGYYDENSLTMTSKYLTYGKFA